MKINEVLELNKVLSIHKLACVFSNIFLDGLIDQKLRSRILTYNLLLISQFLDPRFVRKASTDYDFAVSALSEAFLSMFNESLAQNGN
jgi:hypothetical protein